MNVLFFLVVPLIVASAVIGIGVWRQRRPRSIEASVREFRHGLDALAPTRDPLKRRGQQQRGRR